MLYVINETETKWEIRKTKSEGFFKISKGTTSVGLKDSDKLLEGIKDIIKETQKSLQSTVTEGVYTRIKYNYRDGDPYVVGSDKFSKYSVGLISLVQSRNTSIVNVESRGINILEFGKEPHLSTNEKYINLVLLIDEKVGSYLNLSVLNRDRKSIITYNITLENNNELKVKVSEKEAEEKNYIPVERTKLKYRPVRVTPLVLTTKDGVSMVDAFFKNNSKYYNKEYHNIKVVDDIKATLETLYSETHNKVATIFLNKAYSRDIIEEYKKLTETKYKVVFIQFVNSNKLVRVL